MDDVAGSITDTTCGMGYRRGNIITNKMLNRLLNVFFEPVYNRGYGAILLSTKPSASSKDQPYT